MATFQDCSVGFTAESTYKTYIAPTKWVEFIDESFDFKKGVKQGEGLRVGGRVPRSGRRTVPYADGGGDLSVELNAKGLGVLYSSIFGTGTSTLVSGSTFQQLFTLGDAPQSLTVQKGVPQVGGTVDPYSFLGSMVQTSEFNFPNADIANVKATFDFGDVTTAQSYVAPTYTAGNLFHFAQATINLGGTLTVPTATVAASVSSPSAVSVRDVSIKIDHKLAQDRINANSTGRKSKPTVGLREITGSITYEYDQTTLTTAFLADTDMPLLISYVGTGALSVGFETFQIACPCIRLDDQVPMANKGDLITVKSNFTVLDNLVAAQPIYGVSRTADTTL